MAYYVLLLMFHISWGSSALAHSKAATPSDSLRALLVSIDPDRDPRTVHCDSSLALRSPDIAAGDPRIQKRHQGCTVPEQVSSN